MPVSTEILTTTDGSHTLRSSQFDATYHSTHGAVQESQHVFIEAGLSLILPNIDRPLRIFEMGFGTGLNAYLSHRVAYEQQKAIYYEAVEAFPVSLEQAGNLNYPLQLESDRTTFDQLHALPWNKEVVVDDYFSLRKVEGTLEDATLSGQFDLIYYDAFGPGTQPELWEMPVLEKVYALMAPGGVFVTYCAKGSFKRCLKALGMTVERLPGPPGKREMTRATKTV